MTDPTHPLSEAELEAEAIRLCEQMLGSPASGTVVWSGEATAKQQAQAAYLARSILALRRAPSDGSRPDLAASEGAACATNAPTITTDGPLPSGEGPTLTETVAELRKAIMHVRYHVKRTNQSN